jgi:hypothetical protein
MDSFLGKTGNLAGKAIAKAGSAREKVLQDYMPLLVGLLQEKAGPALLDILSDSSRLAPLAASVYQALPLPVRLVVKEQSFVDWLRSHRDAVVEIVRAKIATPDAELLPEGVVIDQAEASDEESAD